MGGRLKYFKRNWAVIGTDSWISRLLSGYRLPFVKTPPLSYPTHRRINLTVSQAQTLQDEISDLLQKHAIRQADPRSPGYYSQMFVVPKKDGGWRPIINLKSLNSYLFTPHFKLESIQSLKDVLLQNDFMVKVDLKDAYLTVPMHHSAYKYLRFTWKGKCYEFTSLPFGLAPAPLIFTKLLKPIASFLRSQGVRLLVYLDDILLMAPSECLLKEHLALTMSLLENLGFLLNSKKCITEPSQTMEFLGFTINSTEMTLSLPEAKVSKIRKECRHALNQHSSTGRKLAHLIGLLSACIPAILEAPLHYRALQRLKHQAVGPRGNRFDRSILMSQEAQQDLWWWIHNLSTNLSRPILRPSPAITLETDASTLGWGAYCRESDMKTGGLWSTNDQKNHINWLELQGAYLALQSFLTKKQGIHVLLMMDSQVAISYINKMGGTHPQKLSNLALQLWSWCIQKSLTVHAEHVPGRLNVTADYESRHFNDSSDWRLDPDLFLVLNQMFGPFTVDLFASYTNAQMEMFFSWKPDPKSAGIDALAQPWDCHLPYLFPPFALIGRCLQKIRKEKVQKAILVAPIWPAQTWYPLLLDMLREHPRKLPTHNQLILNHWKEPHPLLLQGHLTLAAWPISGDHCQTKAFLEKQPISSVRHGEPALQSHTTPAGTGGLAGVSQGKSILFLQMSQT